MDEESSTSEEEFEDGKRVSAEKRRRVCRMLAIYA